MMITETAETETAIAEMILFPNQPSDGLSQRPSSLSHDKLWYDILDQDMPSPSCRAWT
jgi:hypothetical protein